MHPIYFDLPLQRVTGFLEENEHNEAAYRDLRELLASWLFDTDHQINVGRALFSIPCELREDVLLLLRHSPNILKGPIRGWGGYWPEHIVPLERFHELID